MSSGFSGYHILANGRLLRLLRVIYASTTPVASLGFVTTATPGRTDGRLHTAAATIPDTKTRYDHHRIMLTSVLSSNSRQELPESSKSTALASAVTRREQASDALTVACADAASLAVAANADASACPATLSVPATHSVGLQWEHRKPLWRPQSLAKLKETGFIVVLKLRTQLYLANAFSENGAGSSLIAHLGETATRLIIVVIARERNLILVNTSNPHIEDKLIGEFTVPSLAGLVPLFGYLRVDTQGSSYGAVTVRSSDTKDALCESIYWPEGDIPHARRLGTSKKVRLTLFGNVKLMYVAYDARLIPVQPYKKPVPAFGQCSFVGHRPEVCPGHKSYFCGICGKAGPLTNDTCASHEYMPRCAFCAASHITWDQCCKGHYRAPPSKPPCPASVVQSSHKKRRRRRQRKSSFQTSPEVATPAAINPVSPPLHGTVAVGPPRRGITTDGPPARIHSRAAFARSTQVKTIIAWTQTRSPGRSIVGRPRLARISCERLGRGSLYTYILGDVPT
ncbi:hypothetical protein HPB51_018872 [Rhipicephalus microplus]|uniref:Uncharacterized protein n=1 Tax=Rhipicephalus microplus TaxID=6941 RepID=A0A9J6DPB3_RHIMP|nr:hypothetical protein HPB51_018872 [Rhipicephalus microplus]